MSGRTCDKCVKDKPLSGGKTCKNGHFICNSCGRVSPMAVPVEGRSPATGKAYDRNHCPLCGHGLK